MNYKTTATGVIAILISALSIARTVLDGQPLTDVSVHISSIIAGFGLIFARDAAAK